MTKELSSSRRELLKKLGVGSLSLGALGISTVSGINIRSDNLEFYGADSNREFIVRDGGPVEIRNSNLQMNKNSILSLKSAELNSNDTRGIRWNIDTGEQMFTWPKNGQFGLVPRSSTGENQWGARLDYDFSQSRWRFRTNLLMEDHIDMNDHELKNVDWAASTPNGENTSGLNADTVDGQDFEDIKTWVNNNADVSNADKVDGKDANELGGGRKEALAYSFMGL